MSKVKHELVKPTVRNILSIGALYAKERAVRRYCVKALHYLGAYGRNNSYRGYYNNSEELKLQKRITNILNTTVPFAGRYQTGAVDPIGLASWGSKSIELPHKITVEIGHTKAYLYDKSSVTYKDYDGTEHYATRGTIYRFNLAILDGNSGRWRAPKLCGMSWTELKKYMYCIREEDWDYQYCPIELTQEAAEAIHAYEKHREINWMHHQARTLDYYRKVYSVRYIGFSDNSTDTENLLLNPNVAEVVHIDHDLK